MLSLVEKTRAFYELLYCPELSDGDPLTTLKTVGAGLPGLT